MCRAIRSFPTPLSPVINTLPSLAAARLASTRRFIILGFVDSIPDSEPVGFPLSVIIWRRLSARGRSGDDVEEQFFRQGPALVPPQLDPLIFWAKYKRPPCSRR